jgi:hypothetical protein
MSGNISFLGDLQNDAGEGKDLPGSCSETCPVSSQDANRLVSVKVEVVSDTEQEEVPIQATWQAVKAEHKVS